MKSLSNLQKFLLALAAVFLVLLIVPQLKPEKDNPEQASTETTNIHGSESTSANTPDSATNKITNKKPSEKSIVSKEEPAAHIDEMESELAENQEGPRQVWNIDHERRDPPIKLDPAISDPKTLELAENWKEQFDIGEDVEFKLPYEDVVARIEDVNRFPNGDASWSGHLKGHGDDYAVVVTVGKKVSFATILTPSGEYTVEIVGDEGAVYKTPEVHELSADDSPDYLIPPIAKDLN